MKTKLVNLELLRIISMIFIIALHFLNFGGYLDRYDYLDIKYNIVWLLEALSFVAVNCYVLISGYFLVQSEFKLKRIIKIWNKVIIYSYLIFFILVLFVKVDINLNIIIKSFLPVSSSGYWFATNYIVLCLIYPFLNKIINSINKRQYQFLLIINLIIMSILPIALYKYYEFDFGGSYGIFWFINLYFIAGYLRKYCNIEKYKSINYLMIYIVFSILLVLINFLIKYMSNGIYSGGFIYNYYSIFVLISSICLFCFFKTLKKVSLKLNKIILMLSSVTFDVYLLHENSLVRSILWDSIPIIKTNNSLLFIIYCISIILVIYIVCSFIGYILSFLINIINKIIFNSKIYLKLEEKINCIWR